MRFIIVAILFCILLSVIYKFLKKKFKYWDEELTSENKLSDMKNEIKNKKEIFYAELKDKEKELKIEQKEIEKLKKD